MGRYMDSEPRDRDCEVAEALRNQKPRKGVVERTGLIATNYRSGIPRHPQLPPVGRLGSLASTSGPDEPIGGLVTPGAHSTTAEVEPTEPFTPEE